MRAADVIAAAAAPSEAASAVLRMNGYLELAQRLDDHHSAQHEGMEALRRQLDQVLGDRDALVLQLQMVCDAIEAHTAADLSSRRQAAGDAVRAAVEDARELLADDGQAGAALLQVAA